MGIYTEEAKAIIKTAMEESDEGIDGAEYILNEALIDFVKYSYLGDEIFSLLDEMREEEDEKL